jgi:hypothetical protein
MANSGIEQSGKHRQLNGAVVEFASLLDRIHRKLSG